MLLFGISSLLSDAFNIVKSVHELNGFKLVSLVLVVSDKHFLSLCSVLPLKRLEMMNGLKKVMLLSDLWSMKMWTLMMLMQFLMILRLVRSCICFRKIRFLIVKSISIHAFDFYCCHKFVIIFSFICNTINLLLALAKPSSGGIAPAFHSQIGRIGPILPDLFQAPIEL